MTSAPTPNMPDTIVVCMFDRILSDASYTQHRLGRIPSDEEVSAAVEKVLDAAVRDVAEMLDVHESDVWAILEGERA